MKTGRVLRFDKISVQYYVRKPIGRKNYWQFQRNGNHWI